MEGKDNQTMTTFTLANCDIYTSEAVLTDHVLVVEDGVIAAIRPTSAGPAGEVIDLGGQCVAPGFVDVQVNGGGDVLFNDQPEPEAVRAIATGHRKFGTTDILPTYITGPVEGMRRAVGAVAAARKEGEAGILGVHFEGPLINESKLGVHDRQHLRSADDELFEIMASLDDGKTIVTLAPEVVPVGFIQRLAERGVLVAAGHTNATAVQIDVALREGLTLGTHVWNAMSPMTSREPGAVGALLAARAAWCNFVADGHHIAFPTLGVSIRAAAPRAFLVTDAMSPVGGTKGGYTLGQYNVTVKEGKCVTEDGTLAGSALDLATAVRNLVQKIGLPKDEALRMASTYPAQFLGMADSRGKIAPGYPAHLAIFDNEINVSAVVYNSEYTTV
jgi:N-acetylglucosamine-6-phosphate deacetylase